VKAQNPASEIPPAGSVTSIGYETRVGACAGWSSAGRSRRLYLRPSRIYASTHGCPWLATSPITRSIASNACGADPHKHGIKHLISAGLPASSIINRASGRTLTMFAKLKSLLRRAAERTIPGLWERIGLVLASFTPLECQNYFRHAGYG